MIRKTSEEWTTILEQFENNRVDQHQFCREHGISLAGFRKQLYKWRGKQNNACRNENQPFVTVSSPDQLRITQVKEHWNAIELNIGPVSLKVRRDSDPAALRVALQAMVETCGRT